MSKKIIKIPIQFEKTLGKTRYIYPIGYDSSKIQVIGYGDVNQETKKDHLIGIIDEADLNQFLSISGAEEMIEENAKSDIKRWRPAITTITDAEKVIKTVKKLNINNLSEEDRAILDENDITPGIEKKEFDIKKYL